MEKLLNNNTLLADGAMGTMIFSEGFGYNQCFEELNLSNSDLIKKISRAYLDAGADIIHTNTFGANPSRLKQFGFENKITEINQAAVAITNEICKNKRLVALSVGPTGLSSEPNNSSEIERNYVCQFESVNNMNVDLISIETMTSLTEAKIALQSAKSILPSVPVSVSVCFRKINDEFWTFDQVSISEAIANLEANGADIIGSNCGNSSQEMIEIAKIIRSLTKLPISISPNTGNPKNNNDKQDYPLSFENFVQTVKQLITEKVNIVGGCCGTTPEFIAAVKKEFY